MHSQSMWRAVQASVLSARGEPADAERYAREAVAFAERTDDTNTIADAHVVLGGVLARRANAEAARAELSRGDRAVRAQGQSGRRRSGPRPACSARPRLRRSARLAMATSKFFEVLPLLKDGNTQVGLCVMGPIGTGDNIIWVRAWAGSRTATTSLPRRAMRASTCPGPTRSARSSSRRSRPPSRSGWFRPSSSRCRLTSRRRSRVRPGVRARGERRRPGHHPVGPGGHGTRAAPPRRRVRRRARRARSRTSS